MIKALLFDYDGVITSGVDVKLPAVRLAKNIGITVDEASSVIMSIWDGYSTGRLTTAEVWDRIENRLGTKIADDKRGIWHTWGELTPDPLMLELVKDLQSREYPVGLLSNVFKETADIIRLHGGYEVFDFTILSCEVGAKKPDPKVYERAMEKLEGIQANEVLFLDDSLHCIEGANEFGLRTIHVTNHQSAINDVYKLIEQK